ncbi:hypothetical protein GJAV_G00164320 [Gymnothorax javanicus]|nr:hypothetical protein GJAV_G00164320 [Gymnothorax javanicus]
MRETGGERGWIIPSLLRDGDFGSSYSELNILVPYRPSKCRIWSVRAMVLMSPAVMCNDEWGWHQGNQIMARHH